jgi:hypothetical protein
MHMEHLGITCTSYENLRGKQNVITNLRGKQNVITKRDRLVKEHPGQSPSCKCMNYYMHINEHVPAIASTQDSTSHGKPVLKYL